MRSIVQPSLMVQNRGAYPLSYFDEARHFASGGGILAMIELDGTLHSLSMG